MTDERTRFANVVLPHLGDAYALARWLARNDSDAEDIVQEACLRAFRGIAGFGDINARGWVLSIVRNTAYTWLKRHRDPKLVAVDNVEEVEQAGALPQSTLASARACSTSSTLSTATSLGSRWRLSHV